MVVSFGVLCSSTLLISYVLLIMMLAFRQLLREPRFCSASRLFALSNVSSFAALMRKLLWCTHFWVRYVSATTLLFMPWYIFSVTSLQEVAEYIVLILLSSFSFLLYAWAPSLLLNKWMNELRLCQSWHTEGNENLSSLRNNRPVTFALHNMLRTPTLYSQPTHSVFV